MNKIILNNKSFFRSLFFCFSVLIIFLLNLITIITDASKPSRIIFENISDNLYFLSSPIIFEKSEIDNLLLYKLFKENKYLANFLRVLMKQDKIIVLRGFSITFPENKESSYNAIKKDILYNNKKNEKYLIIKNNFKSLDILLKANFIKYNNFSILIDKEILDDIDSDDNFKFANLYKIQFFEYSTLKEVLIKAHIIKIENKFKEESFLYDDKVMTARIKRAFKERSCNTIINLSDKKLEEKIKINLLSKSFFIKSFKLKQKLYLIIGLFSVILNLLFIFQLIDVFINLYFFEGKIIKLFNILNSIFLILYYIMSIIFEINSSKLNLIIIFFQISSFSVYLSIISCISERINTIISLKELLYYLFILFLLTFLMGLIINSLFFTVSDYWLKPSQYLTYFYYFFPILFLFLLNYRKEKLKIISYILGFILLYFLFKLRDKGLFLTKFEIYLRDFIESFLPARFRFREILFYLLFSFYIILKYFYKTNFKKLYILKNNYPSIFIYFLLFPFLSIINSYYHSYTPLYVSFLRTIFAILISAFTGFVFYLSLKYLKPKNIKDKTRDL